MRKFGIVLIAACASFFCANGVQAQSKVTKKAKTAKVEKAKKPKGKKAEAAVAKVDTVPVSDFSYCMGMAQSEGLKPYLASRLNVDTTKMADFMRGLNEAIANSKDKTLTAYAAGIQIGQQVLNSILPSINKNITDKENEPFVNEEEFKKGFIAGVTGEGKKLPSDSAMKIVQNQMEFYQKRLMEQKYGEDRVAGEKFLAENAKKDGVKLIPGSQVQYKVLKEGNGPVPKATDKVKVNYEGKLIDGTEFDSSYKRNKPATFECNRVIKGWTEALTHMPVGSTWEIYIPQELAYGAQEQGGKIKPFSALIFKVELLSIEK